MRRRRRGPRAKASLGFFQVSQVFGADSTNGHRRASSGTRPCAKGPKGSTKGMAPPRGGLRACLLGIYAVSTRLSSRSHRVALLRQHPPYINSGSKQWLARGCRARRLPEPVPPCALATPVSALEKRIYSGAPPHFATSIH